MPAQDPTAEGWQKRLLIRRAIVDPTEFAFYLTDAPITITLVDLVQVAGQRWTIEACFEAAKGEVGLDHYEVRIENRVVKVNTANLRKRRAFQAVQVTRA